MQAGVAGEPTTFVATYGERHKPVIGIMGEFDALPGLSQAAAPDRTLPSWRARRAMAAAITCSALAPALATVAMKEYLEKNHLPGTLRYYGTPAEEGGAGKVFMIRAGLFRRCRCRARMASRRSQRGSQRRPAGPQRSARFLFHGIAAHAAMAPDRGRSALDAVMLMGNGVEFLREHVPSNSRIHYIICKGGAAPNIVPDLAQMDLVARNPSNTVLAVYLGPPRF